MKEGLLVIQSILLSKAGFVSHLTSFFLKTSCDGEPAFSEESEESLSSLVGRLLVFPFFITNLNFPLCKFNCSVFYFTTGVENM